MIRTAMTAFILTLVVLMSTMMQSQYAVAASLPDMTVPNSLCVQLKSRNHSPADLDRVKAFGAKYIRRGFYWEAIEKKPGVYDFSSYDRLVKECKARGLSILGCMAFGNKLYGPVYEEKGREGYARFAAALAAHFKDDNIIWEIWNEPNTQTFWGKHGKHNSEQYAEEYTNLVKATVPAMKKADPHCFVLGGSVSGLWSASYRWQKYCFQKGILKTGIDAWSVHPYSSKCPEDVAAGYALVRKMMAEDGGVTNMPLVNSERGYPLGKAEGYAGGDIKKSAEYQAWHFDRQYLVDLMCDIRLSNWYEWSGKEGFSLIKGDRESQAYKAGKVMVDTLRGYRYEKRLDTTRTRDYILRFTNDAGGVMLVAWAAPPRGQSPDMTPKHTVHLAVSGVSEVSGAGPMRLTQIYGKESKLEVKDGVIALALSGAPRYVLVSDSGGKDVRTTYRPGPHEAELDMGRNDLKLFEAGADWKFLKNTGEGSFALSKAGKRAVGIVKYDFTRSKSKTTPYVLASVATKVPDSAREIVIDVRSPIEQKVTLRLIDSTGQTHQYKGATHGTKGWETIHIPLGHRLEHWGGANDGRIHYPITRLMLSVPRPANGPKTGTLAFSNAGFIVK